MLPNFLIVGAPKAGTTSLYYYLSEHPEVFMPAQKELNFFSREEIEAQGLYYKDFKVKTLKEYEAIFEKGKGKKAIGEASVSYLFYPKTPFKIKELIPHVKIIILLRDPVERAFSHYLMDYRLGLVNLEFDEIIFKKTHHKRLDLYYQQYIELGFYYKQVKRYLDVFGFDQVRIYFNEDLKNNIKKVILDLYDFLGIDKSYFPNIQKRYNVFSMPRNSFIGYLYSVPELRKILGVFLPDSFKKVIFNVFFEKNKKPQMREDIKRYLRNLYKPDIQKLEKLINKCLSHWYSGEDC